MIKESLEHTIRLIEDIQKVSPQAYQTSNEDLNRLVQHMKTVASKIPNNAALE